MEKPSLYGEEKKMTFKAEAVIGGLCMLPVLIITNPYIYVLAVITATLFLSLLNKEDKIEA